jgi:hypothetical protein
MSCDDQLICVPCAALVKQPQAFLRFIQSAALHPRTAFRRAWAAFDDARDARRGCRAHVVVSHLAAAHACDTKFADRRDRLGKPVIVIRFNAPPAARQAATRSAMRRTTGSADAFKSSAW